MEPYDDNSPIIGFLERNPDGRFHYICYDVNDINNACRRLQKNGARVLGDGLVKKGAHVKPDLFLHPKDFNVTLIEFEQVTIGGEG